MQDLREVDWGHQPNAVLGLAELLAPGGVVLLDCQAGVGVVGRVEDGHHPGWNPQHSHHWEQTQQKMQPVKFRLVP